MTIRDGLELVVADYKINRKRSLEDAERRIRKHLLRLLDPAMPLTGLSSPGLLMYARHRTDEGATPASVNREVAFLRRACTLAGIAWPVHTWRKLRESAPRQGFFEPDQFARVLEHLPQPERALVRFLYLTGWRKSEALGLRWGQVDFTRGEVHLRADETKTGEPRTFPMFPQLRALLEAQADIRRLQETNTEYVFNRCGKPIRCFYDTWHKACREAGVAGRVPHDFRRTSARNLIEAGVDRQVAKELLGHKTESIFDRYRIVSGRERRDASEKLGRFLR